MYQAIGMGAQAIGGMMQAVAASQANREMKQAFEKEIAQQQRFQAQGYGMWQPGTVNMGRESVEGQMATGRGERMQAYGNVGRVPMTPQGSSKLQDRLKLNLMGQLRSSLGQYGDMQHSQGLDLAQLQRTLGRVFDEAGGQARIFPYKMEEAQHSWDSLAAIGQLISSLGGGAANFASLRQQGPQAPAGGGYMNMRTQQPMQVPQWGSGQSMYTVGF